MSLRTPAAALCGACIGLFLAASCAQPFAVPAQKRGDNMNVKDIDRWFATAGDSDQELTRRIEALEGLARFGDEDLQPRLRELWSRRKPASEEDEVDWDPAAAERVVDQYTVLAAYKSGDVSLLPELARLVGEAGQVLEGPLGELESAAKVTRAIGRPEPVRSLTELAAASDARVAANAVRVLQLIGLPEPATGGPISFPELDKPVSFTIRNLREEIEQLESLAEGKIALTPGVGAFLADSSYDRGEVKREDRTLASVLGDDLDMLDFAYAVTSRGVVICTFQEAGARWRQWWAEHAAQLEGQLN